MTTNPLLPSLPLQVIGFIFAWNRSHASPSSSRIRRRRSVVFLELLLLSTLSFFTFGYQVHEKAILLALPPMIPLVLANAIYGRLFLILSTAGFFSLFPLLYQEAETPTKVLLLLTHVVFLCTSFSVHYPRVGRPLVGIARLFRSLPLLNLPETLYMVGFLPLQLATSLGPTVSPAFLGRYPFLPLMATSLYCSAGILYVFGRLLVHFSAEV